MSKNFKIARKPAKGTNPKSAAAATTPTSGERAVRSESKRVPAQPATIVGRTTRKTIEVPEELFYQVKMRALERKMLEKELWAEILADYFKTHRNA